MPAPSPDARAPRGLALGFFGLCAASFGLIVLGALVRAHGAGLSCPDWPLCFGRVVPRFDLRVAFEWTHRAVAGSVALGFVALALLTLRRPLARRACARPLALAGALLALQILLGALTVWHLLASWTVTSHLVVGNGFAASLLWIGLRLRAAGAAQPRPTAAPAVRRWLAAALACLVLQLVLGGLVASRYAGMACPEWPTCYGGRWFPSWSGAVGLHVLHRSNGYLLALLLATSAWQARGGPLGRLLTLAATLGLLQVGVGVLNVRFALPVEITGLHSALAAGLVLSLAAAGAVAFRRDEGTPT